MGVRADSAACPVQRAISRAVRGGVAVYVSYADLYFSWNESDGRRNGILLGDVHMPSSVSHFAIAFDDLQDVNPFTFELELEEHLLKPRILLPEFAQSLTERVIAESAQITIREDEEVLV